MWVTPHNSPNEDLVQCSAEGSSTWEVQKGSHQDLPNNTPYDLHQVALTGLKADQTYRFRIGNETKEYQFHTLSSDPAKPLKFVAGGDMYHDDMASLRETNHEAASRSPAFALLGGDIAYASGLEASESKQNRPPQTFDRWHEWLQAWTEDMVTPEGNMIPMVSVIGNHDTRGGYDQKPEEAPFFYALFPTPGNIGRKVIDIGSEISLILLDSGHTHPVDGEQTEWLEKTLKERQDIRTKFVTYHVPAYPSGRPAQNARSTAVRKHWVPLFDKYGVTMSFENHDHTYKRTHPITNGAIDPNGVLYVGDGAWGIKDLSEPKNAGNPLFAKTAKARHFIEVQMDDENATIAAISSAGDIIDTCTHKLKPALAKAPN